jgi:UDP-N-acetylmuramoyl-L-alanyl-D-glutamate--2,6-diaminopimelate ligase
MADYAAAKSKLFAWPTLRQAVLNLDDALGRELAARLAARPPGQRPAVIGVSTNAGAAADAGPSLDARLRAESIEHRPQGLRFRVVCERNGTAETALLETGLFGDFNVANLLGVVGAALACGVALPQAAAAVAGLQAPPGRLQRVARDPLRAGAGTGAAAGRGADEPLAIVDYAHTPDAIAKALQALRPIARARRGRLWIVFGAGGDRDRGKRPVMAAAAAAAADAIVLTSDNPRGESAESILDELAAGIPAGTAFERHADRAAAIRAALLRATERDVVLIAGKGHEDYQEIAGQRLPFSDVATARAALHERAGPAS